MKVSKAQQAQMREDIINAAIGLFVEKGIKATTMRSIAEASGYSTATVYKYFSTREKIVYGFFELKAEQSQSALEKIPNFQDFSLKEKLQAQLETLLDHYLDDREFILMSQDLLFQTPVQMFSGLEDARTIHVEFITQCLVEATEKNEIQEQPMSSMLSHLYWNYAVLMILYWTNDESMGFEKTSQLIDSTLDLIVEFLHSNLLNKMGEIGIFIFKSHFQRSLGSLETIFDNLASLREKLKE